MQQSAVNIYDEDDDDGPKSDVTIGPSIPVKFSKVPESLMNDNDNDDGHDDGSELPPHLRDSMSTPGPSTAKRQVGPTFPSYAPTYDPKTYPGNEDDDDDFGPKHLPAGMQHQQRMR